MRTVSAFRFVVIGIIALLLGCAPIVPPGEQFDSVTRDYLQRLRWMDWNGAARHIAEEQRDEFLERFGSLKDLHVTDARLESVEMLPEDSRALTRIALEYYMLPSATVKTLMLRQEWIYHPGDRAAPGIWRMVTPFPPLP